MLPTHYFHLLAQALLLLLCLDFAVGLRTRSAEGISAEPSVIIVGIGDSGTTAVTQSLELMGMEYCHERDRFEEPPWGHDDVRPLVQTFLNATRHEFSQASFAQNKTAFDFAQTWFHNVSRKEHECITRQRQAANLSTDDSTRELKWGFKEPHYSWLLPVMDAAFNNRTKYLMIARDPRDICTAENQDQFLNFGKRSMPNQNDCFVWWGSFWKRILDAYESDPRFAIVRIEDLVTPAPNASTDPLKKMGCMARHVGMKVHWSRLETGVSVFGRYGTNASAAQKPGPEGTSRALEGKSAADSDAKTANTTIATAAASTNASANASAKVGGAVGGPQESSAFMAELMSWHFYFHRDMYFGRHNNLSETSREKLVNRTSKLNRWARETMLRLGYNPAGFNLLTPTSPAVLCRDSA